MKKVNENKSNKVELIRHYIKDLSFENLQDINQNKSSLDNNYDIFTNMNVIYEPYKDNFFSIITKITLDCSSQKEKNKISHLELDYFSFFKNLTKNSDQKLSTENGLKLVFPYAKSIIEDISHKGNIPIILNNLDFNLVKN